MNRIQTIMKCSHHWKICQIHCSNKRVWTAFDIPTWKIMYPLFISAFSSSIVTCSLCTRNSIFSFHHQLNYTSSMCEDKYIRKLYTFPWCFMDVLTKIFRPLLRYFVIGFILCCFFSVCLVPHRRRLFFSSLCAGSQSIHFSSGLSSATHTHTYK